MKSCQKYWYLFLTGIALLCGCKTTVYHDMARNVRVTDRRFLMNTAADVTFEVGTNGVNKITLKAQSRPDIQAVEAVAKGFAAGLATGVAP
jgi:hypothetical protein